GSVRYERQVVEKRVERPATFVATPAPVEAQEPEPLASAVARVPAVSEKLPAVEKPQEKILDKSAEGIYTVQVASYKKEDQAKDAAAKLQKKGYESLVLPKGDYSIVCVGRFNKKSEAQNLSRKLKKDYKDCLVRKI
ncbi:MAG: SPOR domain-containing protein, partial [Candidatus Omnitrophica bacterium]|nr:SPOR domain-containing protein [Candidatus Omnitrophota bacterium]